jgi:hypothetical protein
VDFDEFDERRDLVAASDCFDWRRNDCYLVLVDLFDFAEYATVADVSYLAYLAVSEGFTQILLVFLLVRLAPGIARGRALVRRKALDELRHRKVLIYPQREL